MRHRRLIAPALLAGAFATFFFASLAFARPLAAPPAINGVSPASATAGQGFTVIIAGANFEVTSTVSINSVALAVDSATTDTITATASAGVFNLAGIFPLVVTTSEGQANSSFEIVAGPAAQIGIAPASTGISAGGSIAFTAAVSDAFGNPVTTGTVSWSMTAGTGTPIFSGQTSRSVTFSTTSAGAKTIQASFNGGAPSTTASVSVGPSTPLLSVAPAGTLNIDAGGSVPYTATVADVYGNSVTTDTVQWDGSAGTFSPNTGNTTSYSPPATPGTYFVTATLQSTGQKVNRQVTVQAGAATQITLQPANPINLVAGNTVAFTATLLDAANNPTTNGTVTWAASGGSLSGGALTKVFSPTNVAGTYFVTATLGNGQAQSRQVTVSPAAASTLSIAQSATSVTAGSTAWFTATVVDAFGNAITSGTVNWSKISGPGTLASNPPRSATLATGAGTGTATLQASYAGVPSVNANLIVNAGNPAQLSISPLNPSMTAGGTIAFTALVSDSFGNTTSSGNVTWDVTSGSGAFINPLSRSATFTSSVASSSVVRARITGAPDVTTTVTVNAAGASRITLTPSSATLPVNGTQGFSAFAFDVFNNVIANATFNWSSADTTKATVNASGSSATLSAKTTAGVYASLLRVSSGGITQTATITISPGAPTSIVLTPSSATNTVSTTRTFDASVLDAWGNVVPNTALIWSVSSTQVGQIAATDGDSALFTASTIAGVYPAGVRVSTGSITQTADITLTADALNAVTLDPNGITIMPSGSIGIVATGRDRFGNPISGLQFTWSVSGAAGSIAPASPGSANATFTAGTVAGSYANAVSASATQGGTTRIGTASVLITTDQVARIDVSPASASLQPTGQQIFTARGYDQYNNLIWPLEVSWGVKGAGVITKTGSVTATFSAGTVAGIFAKAVSASTQGVTGTADVTVNAGPLFAINLTPGIVVLGINSQQPFNAAGIDAWGNSVPGFSATWSVSPPSAGSFDSMGPTSAVFRAGNTPGTYNKAVRASSGNVSSTATVIVQPGTVASVSLTPASATLPINGTRVFTATVRDQGGNALPGLSVLWQVSPNAGTISSSGLLTVAVKAGTNAGTFISAVRAFNGVYSATANLVVQAGAPTGLAMTASPATLQTNGINSSEIEVAFIDAFGNPTGAGTTVQWEIVQCSGDCVLSALTSQADANGHARTSIRSDYRTPQGTTSIIIVRAIAGNLNQNVSIIGQFLPITLGLPLIPNNAPPNNHTSCKALVISPPQTVQQPANNAFNIYRFTATTTSYRVSVNNYGTTGRLLLYRITSDNCAANNTLTVVYVKDAGITSPTSFETAFNNLFTPGQTYLLAVNTTGAFTSQPYSITIQP